MNELAFTAHRHAGQFFMPGTKRHLGLRVEPFRQKLQLWRGNLPTLDAIEEVLEQRRWDVMATDLRHNVRGEFKCRRTRARGVP